MTILILAMFTYRHPGGPVSVTGAHFFILPDPGAGKNPCFYAFSPMVMVVNYGADQSGRSA
jgi:hypothetical protein